MKTELHVRIGKIQIASAGEVLKTVLGSCVGIAIVWRRKGRCALAHCLLPFPVDNGPVSEARCVSLTIPRMLQLLGAGDEDCFELEAIVAGGGQMMDVEKSCIKFIVGSENLKAAKEHLNKHRIKIIAFEAGGDQGTKMRIDSESGHFEIEKIPKVA